MSASFTCDSCGARVDLHAESCPSCHRAFDAVRCPRCSHQGSPAAFTDGCPQCGYLAKPSADRRRPELFVPLMSVLAVLLAVAVAFAWVLRGR